MPVVIFLLLSQVNHNAIVLEWDWALIRQNSILKLGDCEFVISALIINDLQLEWSLLELALYILWRVFLDAFKIKQYSDPILSWLIECVLCQRFELIKSYQFWCSWHLLNLLYFYWLYMFLRINFNIEIAIDIIFIVKVRRKVSVQWDSLAVLFFSKWSN